MRLIDADSVFRWYVETFSEKNIGERAIQPNEIRFSMNDIRDNLYNIPTIDAVEVVRCKDCEYFSEPDSFSGKCTLRGDYIFTNDFCSYAVERRTDELGITN